MFKHPLLRPEGSPMSWNFQQIYPIIKDDNWCQSWLDFSDLNPNSDDIIYTDLMSPIYFIFSWGLTSHTFTSLQGTNFLYIGPKPLFLNQGYLFFILNFWAAFKVTGLHMARNEVFGT